MQRFRAGDPVVVREVWHGRVFEARPTIVVQDDPGQAMFFLPGGVRCGIPLADDGRELRLPDRPWRLEVRPRGDQPILTFAWPDTPYSVLLWTAEDQRRMWYVNLQDPLARTPIGFDTVDHALDVVIELDRSSWRWKDEEELAEAVRDGLFSEAEAADFYAWGERAIERVLTGEPPFNRDWEDWRPEPRLARSRAARRVGRRRWVTGGNTSQSCSCRRDRPREVAAHHRIAGRRVRLPRTSRYGSL